MEPWGGPLSNNVLPRKNIEGPLWDFLKANPWPHPRPDQRPKTLGPAAPLVFGLQPGLDCDLRFAFRKSLGGPSIFSLAREYIEYSWEPPMGLRSPCYLFAFPLDCPSLDICEGGQLLDLAIQVQKTNLTLCHFLPLWSWRKALA